MNSQFLIEPLTLIDQIQTKRKIKNVDVHKSLPWILFSDKDNNIIIYDISTKHPIRAFTLQQYFQDNIQIRSLKFLDTNDKKYITHYGINDNLRIKGISLNLRNTLIIITIEKYICFYSYVLQNFVRVISMKDIGDESPVKCELFNYLYAIILTEDGNLKIWNLKDWNLVLVLSKSSFGGKICTFFSVICTEKEEKFVVAANKNGNLYLLDMNKKDVDSLRLDTDKNEHDSPVLIADFNPKNNILMTYSKSQILLIDIKNPKNYRKIPNFEYVKKQKVKGITSNLSSAFNQASYFVYGKTSFLLLLEFDIDDKKSTKLDYKSARTYTRYAFDLNNYVVQKVNDKPTKINNAVFLLNTNDYLILATNKGIYILKIDSSNKPAIAASEPLIEMNKPEQSLHFLLLDKNFLFQSNFLKGILNSKTAFDGVIKPALTAVFDKEHSPNKLSFHRYKMYFSFDYSYLAVLDTVYDVYSIYKVDTLRDGHNFNVLFTGQGVDFVWCPYDNIIAISSKGDVKYKNGPVLEIKPKPSSLIAPGISKTPPSTFNVKVFQVEDKSLNLLYEVQGTSIHRIFGGHFLGVFKQKAEESNEGFTMSLQTKYAYGVSNKMEIQFFNWKEKKNEKITINQEPTNIYWSRDLDFLVICFEDKYCCYKLNSEKGTIDLINVNYYKVIDGFVYDSLTFVFLTDNGIYFQILNEENGYPFKMFKFSNEMNNFHLRLSKESKEKEILYNKKHFQQKLIGIYHNNLVTSNSLGEITIQPCDHILLKIIHAVRKMDLNELHQLLLIVEKKFIQTILSIFDFYFENDEQILRKIFDRNLIEHFELYKYMKMFIRDLASSNKENSSNEIEKIMKHNLIKAVNERNDTALTKIHGVCSSKNLQCELLAAQCLNKETFFKSLFNNRKYFECAAFNNCYSLNDMNNMIINKALENINSSIQK